MNRKEIGLDLVVLGILAAAVFAFFWPAGLFRSTFFVQDVMVQNYPFRHFFAQTLKEGSLALWNPALNCGFPLFAEGQAGLLYPFNLLTYLALTTHAALNANILFHFWLAGTGTYLFLRSIGAGRSAGLTAGLAYACSGFLVVRAMSPNYVDASAWMPFLFLLVELTLKERRLVYLPLAGGVVGLQLLAGHPQASAYGLLAGMGYGLVRGIAQGEGWKFAAWILLGVPLMGAGLAAAQLLPTAELVQVSARGGGLRWEQFVSMSLPPERLVTLLLPNFFGNSGTGSYWGREAGFFIQLCAFGGVVPLFLGMVALWERRDLYTGFFGGLCGIALVLSLGKFTVLFDLLYQVPGLNFFRIPTRFLLWFAFGLAVLAGLGLERVVSRSREESPRGWWWGAAGALMLAGGMIWLNRQILFGGMFLEGRWGTELRQYASELRFDTMRMILLAVIGGCLLSLRGRRWQKIAGWIIPLIVFCELFSFGRGFNGLVEAEVYLDKPAAARAITADAGEGRRHRPRILSAISEENAPYDWHGGWMLDQNSYRKYPQTLRMYTGGLYGLENALPGWSPLHLRRHWEFMRGYMAFADLAGIEYVITYKPSSVPRLEPVFAGEVRVYRNTGALPRAYLVGDYRVIKGSRERLHYLKGRGFDPRHQVVLEEEPEGGSGGAGGKVEIERYAVEEVEVGLEGHKGGILVLSDTFYPGWRAYVDGQERPIMRANHVFRGVAVPAGARSVLFRYESRSFRMGAWMSGVACTIWVGLLGWSWQRRFCGIAEEISPECGVPLKIWTVQMALILLIHGLASRWDLWVEALERSRVLSVWGVG